MVVLITGCSSGIGDALAHCFLEKGHDVIATARCIKSIKHLEWKGIDIQRLDVNDRGNIKTLGKYVECKYGSIDILVNNAGYALTGSCLSISEDQLFNQLDTNVVSPVMMIQEFAPAMIENRHGRIINIGSISGLATTPFSGAYGASKSALHSISDALRVELSKFNIKVITVHAGGIQSNFSNNRIMENNPDFFENFDDIMKTRKEVFTKDAMPAHEFAQRLVKLVMKKDPKPIVKIGKNSVFLPLMKAVLPTRLFDNVIKHKLGI